MNIMSKLLPLDRTKRKNKHPHNPVFIQDTGGPVRNPDAGMIISKRLPFLYSPFSLIVKPVISRIFWARKRPEPFVIPAASRKEMGFVLR